MQFEESPAIRLRAAYLHLHRSANRHFRQFDATADQYAVLTCLHQEPGRTQQDIVGQLASDKRTIGKILDLLESKGLIERRQHPDDGRAWSLFLTREGRKKQELLYHSAEFLRRRLEEAIPVEHFEIVLDALHRIAQRLDPEDIPPVISPPISTSGK